MSIKLDIAKMACFLLENGYERYCCLAIEKAALHHLACKAPRLEVNNTLSDLRRFYDERWIPQGHIPFWNETLDPPSHESRLACMRAWVASLEEQEPPR